MSKIYINVFAGVFAREPEVIKKGVQSYVGDPGFCKTDIVAEKMRDYAPRTYLDGAKTFFWLAELPFKVNPDF